MKLQRLSLLAALAASLACGPGTIKDKVTNPDTYLKAGERVGKSMDAKSKAIDSISADDERAVGQAAAINVIANYGGLVLDEGLTQYVNEVGNLVAKQGKRRVLRGDGSARIKSRRVFVGVLNDSSLNAFSLPGGYILVTRGLLESLQSESDLAWILGHEIAHFDFEHGLLGLKTQMGAGAGLSELVTGGAINLKDTGVFKKIADSLADTIVNRGWDKEAEVDADKWGLDYSTKAGYDGVAAARVLGVLASAEAADEAAAKSAGKTKPVDKSHASPKERYDVLKKLISSGAPAVASRYDEECLKRLEAYSVASLPKSRDTN